jgi:hypothetical protein
VRARPGPLPAHALCAASRRAHTRLPCAQLALSRAARATPLTPHRTRSALVNLAPTSTGSASAIALIFPDLKGKLNGLAVRVPLTNASITDCVFEVRRRRRARGAAAARWRSVLRVRGVARARHACAHAHAASARRRALLRA